MPPRTSDRPPRPLNAGDVLACPDDLLGERVAARITNIDSAWKKVGVLELDWSGPDTSTTDDLGAVEPLRLTHHFWNGWLSHANCDWVPPRSWRVLGSLPVIGPSDDFSLVRDGQGSIDIRWPLATCPTSTAVPPLPTALIAISVVYPRVVPASMLA